MAGLVGGFGDHRGDPAGAQVRPVSAGGVGLVAAQHGRSGTWPARALPGHAERGQQRVQLRRVARLAGRDGDDQGSAAPVDQRVGLGRQPAAGPADAVIARFVLTTLLILVVRQPPVCDRALEDNLPRTPSAGGTERRAVAPC